MSEAEEKAKKAIETCENLQVMIDISAKTLRSLREQLQSNPSSQVSQALREAEAKLVKMFSRQLVSKATVSEPVDIQKLNVYPNTEQWLQVVGLPSKTVKGLVSENITLDRLLRMNPETIGEVMKSLEAHQSETNTLNKALGKLKAWTESQMSASQTNNTTAVDKSISDLFWTDSHSGSPYSQRSNKLIHHTSQQAATSRSRPTSTSSISRSSTSSVSSDQQQTGTWNSSHSYSNNTNTLASQHSGSSGHQSAVSSPYYSISSRSPLQPPGTPTQFKGRSRPNTPPPQIRNVINTSQVFVFPTTPPPGSQTTSSHPASRITSSVSHDSTLVHKPTPFIEPPSLISSSHSVDESAEVSSLYSSKSADYSSTRQTPSHRIGHRFETKNFKFGRCDYCKKSITLVARVCRYCKYKCHKDCEKNISQYSCGLTDDLVKEATKIFSDSRNNIVSQPLNSPVLSSYNSGSIRRLRGSTSIQDSSSASSYTSSSPSSPLYNGAMSSQGSPANIQQFTFPQAGTALLTGINLHTGGSLGSRSISRSGSRSQTASRSSSRAQLVYGNDISSSDVGQSTVELRSGVGYDSSHDDSRQLTIEEKDRLTSTVSTIDSQDTVIASRGTSGEISVDCMKSEGSDQTIIDSNSSEKTLPEQLEASYKSDTTGGGDSTHTSMYRQPSLSKALEEWDIPYSELIVEDELGTGHVGTVYRGQWHGPVAIKKIPINPAVDLDAQLLAFKQEIATLKKTRHDNVVLFMGACMKPPELAIVTSFVNGDTLYKETRTASRLPLSKIINIASQITQGMGYLHSKDIIHKHLTSKNIFVERGEKVVITDFGLQNVARLASHHSSRADIMRIPDGWLSYLSPEVIKALRITEPNEITVELPFSKQSDVYAFGTIWYELLCGHWPHTPHSHTAEMIIWQTGRGLKPSLYGMGNTTKEAKDILMKCWMYSGHDRISFSVLSNSLEKLPKKRLTRSPSHPPIQLSRSIDSFFRLLE